HFRRVITISKWVGVKVDPASSPVSLTAAANAPPGLLGQVIVVTPHDRRGEYLGPFRDGQVSINATAGSFSGPVETRLDGSYVRTLFYKREEQPIITVSVDGTQVYPKPSDLEGCFKAVLTFLKHLLEALKSVTSPSHWRKLMFWKK
ncbi:MAG TPA: hypothetical protein VFY10_00755, partial [Dehalococcoidia bacterium]|nr:hypothetical protein [Dehalococcoidia bacterium]